MEKAGRWPTPVILGLVLAAIGAGSGVVSNYQQYLQAKKVAENAAAPVGDTSKTTKTDKPANQPKTPEVSIWPFVTSSLSMVAMLVLLIIASRSLVSVMRDQARQLQTHSDNIGDLKNQLAAIDTEKIPGIQSMISSALDLIRQKDELIVQRHEISEGRIAEHEKRLLKHIEFEPRIAALEQALRALPRPILNLLYMDSLVHEVGDLLFKAQQLLNTYGKTTPYMQPFSGWRPSRPMHEAPDPIPADLI